MEDWIVGLFIWNSSLTVCILVMAFQSLNRYQVKKMIKKALKKNK